MAGYGRANWHLDDLDGDSDPKTPQQLGPKVQAIVRRSEGTRIAEGALWNRRDETTHPTPVGYWLEADFTFATPLDHLLQREVVLGEREQRMHADGVRCEIKWNPGVTCSTCPVHEVGRETPLSFLCRLGREQERIHSMVVTKQMTLKGEV